MHSKPNIPRLPHFFFRWYCRPGMYEELHGDLEEFFYERAEEKGLFIARLLYLWDVIRCFQPYAWKTPSPASHAGIVMFRNYFKVSVRSLAKNPLNSFINIFGLAAAIGICIFAYTFARWTFSTDQFHEYKNEVYLVTFFAGRDGTQQQYGTTPRPLGDMLRQDFTHVKKVCRVEDRQAVVKQGDRVFHELLRYTDPDFLQMLTFPMKWGSSSSLSDINSIVLSENMSVKYFGEENPVGRDILVKFDESRSKVFRVGGVTKAFPKASTIRFSFLVNFENLRTADPAYNLHDWNALVNATLIQVDNPAGLAAIEQGMEKYRALQNQSAKDEWAISAFSFEPLATLHKNYEHIKDGISWSSGDNYVSVIYLAVISMFMLALACFNYINIAIVSAAKRLKEIGIRKTIGATRGTVIVQFLAENIIITFFALVLGLILGLTVFIPRFEDMWSFNMGFRFDDPVLWVFLPAILLFTSFASGIYPSLYISRFQVVGILKGTARFGKKNPLTRILLGLQLMFACIFITCAVSFTQNTNYLASRSWGYNQKGVLYAEVPDLSAFEQLNEAMTGHPDVLATSGSHDHLGRRHATAVAEFPGRQYETDQLSVDARYFETTGLTLTKGRTFRANHESDKQAVVVNEFFAKSMAPASGEVAADWPVGQIFKMDSVRYEIIGVVSDFHNYDFSIKIAPTIFRLAEEENYRYLSIRVQPGTELQSYDVLQARWASLFPETPFTGGFQEDVWGFYYNEIDIHALVWQVMATIAITLAGLGLYGLVTLNVAGRIREFSIRKVLGAGTKGLAANITGRYMWLFALALVPGAIASHLLSKFIIETSYTYHIPVSLSGVTIAVAVLVFALLLSVAIQVRGLSTFNPVKGLRAE